MELERQTGPCNCSVINDLTDVEIACHSEGLFYSCCTSVRSLTIVTWLDHCDLAGPYGITMAKGPHHNGYCV